MVSFCCIFIQLSTEVPVALLIRIAISGLRETFSWTNSERAFLLIPNIPAASVIDKFNGFKSAFYKDLAGFDRGFCARLKL